MSRFSKSTALVWSVVLVLAAPALAQEVSIEVDPAGDSIDLAGTPDADGKLSRALRLTARGGDTGFRFLPTGLSHEGGAVTVPPQSLTLAPTDLELTQDLPRTYRLDVKGLTEPGTYRGTIRLEVPGEPGWKRDLDLAVVVQRIEFGLAELVLSGVPEAEKLERSLRLTARGSDAAVFLLSSDLTLQSGELVLDRSHVKLSPAATSLTRDRPLDLAVAVDGLETVGTYSGEITVGLDSRPATTWRLPLRVEVRAVPDLKPAAGTQELKFKLVRCQNRFTCWLAGILLPGSAQLNEWRLQFENPNGSPVKLERLSVSAIGEHTLSQLTDEHLARSGPAQAPELQYSIPLAVRRPLIEPDHYTGSVSVKLLDLEQPFELPLDLNMRSGPFWPTVWILVGILLGRLVLYFKSVGSKQAKLLTEMARLEQRIEGWGADGAILQPAIDSVRELVYRRETTAADQDWAKVEARAEALGDLRQLEAALAGLSETEELGTIRAAADEIRRLLRLEKDAQVATELESLRKQVEDYLAKKPADRDAGAADGIAASAARVAATSAARSGSRLPSVASPSSARRLSRWTAQVVFASEALAAESTLWLRPLLYIVLLLGLLAVGLDTLYVSNGATLGAKPFSDYLGLVLWGLSSDVASRTLSNLQG